MFYKFLLLKYYPSALKFAHTPLISKTKNKKNPKLNQTKTEKPTIMRVYQRERNQLKEL